VKSAGARGVGLTARVIATFCNSSASSLRDAADRGWSYGKRQVTSLSRRRVGVHPPERPGRLSVDRGSIFPKLNNRVDEQRKKAGG
jgi:hypothetical protein